MEMAVSIRQAETPDEIEAARTLFREYETLLGLDLFFQGFEEELRTLPGRYELPEGRLHLAYVDDRLAGCIALRKLEDGICEMKRLYVRDEFRGSDRPRHCDVVHGGLGFRLCRTLP